MLAVNELRAQHQVRDREIVDRSDLSEGVVMPRQAASFSTFRVDARDGTGEGGFDAGLPLSLNAVVIRLGMVGLIGLAVCGCGSSKGGADGGAGTTGAGGGAGTGGAGGGTAHVTWRDDGTLVTAIGGSATRVLFEGKEILEIIGATNDLSIRMTVSDDPPLTPKTFMCNQPAGLAGATFIYSDVNASPGVLESPECTVTLTQVGTTGGPSAVGTFTAILAPPSGVRRNITDGSFDVPYPGFSN